MEITTQVTAAGLEVKVNGRLDAYWADHLARALDDVVRGGAHRLQLDLAEVAFISSMGIRVLLRFYKQLQRIQGDLYVVNPSPEVHSVLELAGLAVLLEVREVAVEAPDVATRLLTRGTTSFAIHAVAPAASLQCRIVGDPSLLASARFAAADCQRATFAPNTFGIGLGAFGNSYADCHNRFGEFLCAGGAAAYLPTDGSNVPDYLVASGALVPQVQVLYALVCEGACAWLAHFDTPPGATAITLAELAAAGLEICAADTVGFVVAAESAGLLGAALRRSPATPAANSEILGYPQIREWLSFTPERAHGRGVALVVGVASRNPPEVLQPFLRPLGDGVLGHFHAAAFSYHPLAKGVIELAPTVSALFDREQLQGVLHLLNDDRDIVGTGQSELVRGACWLGPIAEITANPSSLTTNNLTA